MIIPPMTPPQLRAATSDDRLCYVKAGPGSGKTFTAAQAFGYLRFVRYRSDPRGVCGVTFARSARKELVDRAARRWGCAVTDWPNSICTFDELHRRLVRYLVHHGSLQWPGGRVPERPDDSWAFHPHATPSPGKKPRLRTGLNPDGRVGISGTTSQIRAPNPVFVDPDKFEDALASGRCTHADIRNVLVDAADAELFPALNQAIRRFLATSYCHLVVDEAFDMNALDVTIIERAIEAGLGLTVVGDPWQSIYEFRGSRPKLVTALIANHPFRWIDMPGEHRYKSTEMIELAGALFRNEPFRVAAAKKDKGFEVVLAHDWGTLWAESRIHMVPAGKPNKLDRSQMSSCLVLLLNEYVRDVHGIDVSGVGEARRALWSESASERLAPVLDALRDATRTPDDIWDLLREAFQPTGGKPWGEPGAIARVCLERLAAAARTDGTPLLGLSVHQAKGLEWDRVLFLDDQLSTEPDELNLLDIEQMSHRNVYVALTRAKSAVRVAFVPPGKYGVKHSPIERVPA